MRFMSVFEIWIWTGFGLKTDKCDKSFKSVTVRSGKSPNYRNPWFLCNDIHWLAILNINLSKKHLHFEQTFPVKLVRWKPRRFSQGLGESCRFMNEIFKMVKKRFSYLASFTAENIVMKACSFGRADCTNFMSK